MKRLALLLLLSLPLGAREYDVEDIFAHARRVNPTLSDYTASIEVDLDAKMGFVHDHPHLKGTYYYKREGKHRADLPNAPSYVKRQPNVLGFSLPRLDRYQARILDTTPKQWHIELTAREKEASIRRVELWVDRATFTVPHYTSFYAKQGKVDLKLDYQKSSGYLVPQSMHADISFPAVMTTGTADVRYSGYSFNQGLKDSFFVTHGQ